MNKELKTIILMLLGAVIGVVSLSLTHTCEPWSFTLTGPNWDSNLTDPNEPDAYTFDDLLDAIEYHESRGIATALGLNGELGAYQLKKIYVNDYIRLTGNMWVSGAPDIRLNKYGSRDITRTVTQHYAHIDCPDADVNDIRFLEQAARAHYGSGMRNSYKSDAYWQDILKVMKEQK